MARIAIMAGRNVSIPPVRGGAIEHWIVNVTRRLPQYEFFIVSPADPALPGSERNGHICYHRIHENRVYLTVADWLHWDPFHYFKRAARWIQRAQPDIIHLFNVPRSVALFRRSCPSAKVILHCMNTTAQIGKRSQPRKRDAIRVNLFLGCSQFLLQEEKEGMGRNAEQFGLLANGADVDRILPWWNSLDRDQVRNELHWHGKKVILFAGRLNANKGVDILVKAMQHLRKDVPEAVLCILGARGFGRNGSQPNHFVKSLERDISRSGNSVQFLGFVEPERMHAFYEASDLFCLPVRWNEPFSLAVCEAAAAGLPVVASRAGGTPELIEDGISGFLVDANCSPEQLAVALLSVLNDPARARLVGEEARRRVEVTYNWDAIAESLDAWYQKLLS